MEWNQHVELQHNISECVCVRAAIRMLKSNGASSPPPGNFLLLVALLLNIYPGLLKQEQE